MKLKLSGDPSGRGQASGVALLGSLPFRPARLDFPADWATSTRVLHSVVSLGPSHVQVFVVYCKPCNSAAAMPFNNGLLRFVIRQANLLPLPFIIMGDFNCCPSTLECWPDLQAQGCMHLADLHLRLHGAEMPPTCKGSTRPDTAIVSSLVVPLVQQVSVLDPSWFCTHCPVVFRLNVPPSGLFQFRSRFPKSFIDFGLNEDDIACSSLAFAESEPESLQQWGSMVESVVDATLRDKHPSVRALPKSYRGRCKPLKPMKVPILAAIKPASHGDYDPPVEVLTMVSRRRTKQLRRLESFKQRMCKYEKHGATTSTTCDELRAEWHAILSCSAFGTSFLHWLWDMDFLEFPSLPFPSVSWLAGAIKTLRSHVASLVRHDLKVRMDLTSYERHLDKSSSQKSAFARVRGPGNPPVWETLSAMSFHALVVPSSAGHYDVFAVSGDLAEVRLDLPLHVGDHACVPVSNEIHYLVVRSDAPPPFGSDPVPVCQSHYCLSPQDVACHFNQYWTPLWTRDALSLDSLDLPNPASVFPCLANFVRSDLVEVDMQDITVWMSVIRGLKS